MENFLLFILKFAFLWCIIIIVYMVRQRYGKLARKFSCKQLPVRYPTVKCGSSGI